MREPSDVVRDHLERLLHWEDGHVGFDKAVAGLPASARGVRPPGFEHSVWELIEHIRIAQEDILDFSVNDAYQHTLAWPADYWPRAATPPEDAAWDASVAAVVASRERLETLVRDQVDLTASVPTGDTTQTFLRAVLLAADHAAYHVGQIVQVRKALGVWG
jgi:DinB superfamily